MQALPAIFKANPWFWTHSLRTWSEILAVPIIRSDVLINSEKTTPSLENCLKWQQIFKKIVGFALKPTEIKCSGMQIN